MSPRNRRGTARIVGRRHLDHIHPHQIDPGKPAQDREGLRAGKPAGHGRAGAGREGRIEAVDIEAEITARIAHDPAHLLGHRGRPRRMHRGCVDDVHAKRIGIGGANADLNRTRRLYQPLLHRLVEHGAVIDPAHVVIGPGIGVGIELDQRKGAVFRRMGPQDGEGDVMIPPKAQRRRTGPDNFCHMGLKHAGKIGNAGIIEGQIAVIDNVQFAHRIHLPAIGRIRGQQSACLADRARTEAGTRTVCHRAVEGDAGHRQIDTLQILGQAAPQEGGHAAEGVFEGKPFQPLAGDRAVHLMFRILKRHVLDSLP